MPPIEIKKKIYEDAKIYIYRVRNHREKQAALVKTLKNDSPSIEEITSLRQEYEILKNIECSGIIKPYKLEKYQNNLALILEDFEGLPLSQLIKVTEIGIADFLNFAISLAETLVEIHRVAIVHSNIKPSNISIDPKNKKVKLTGFNNSITLAREPQTISISKFSEADLAYISPEQTGRMNRSVDYRTDFYSLGVTFYETLTKELPFNSKEAIELIHSIVAKQPIPPCQKKPIPPAISDIIIKLLAKNPEDRYQSAAGLKFDLEQCLLQLENTGKISKFSLGKRDRGNSFIIPQKLYGRDTEVKTLLDAFARVARGATEIALVSGYSGIGKTSVVNEVHKPIVAARGYFISGKFDQFKADIPYSALIQAFQKLIDRLLTESDAKIAIWKDKLLNALAGNGQIIINIIPEVELIIGSQPELPKLGLLESENRFNLVFQQFLNVFCQPEHPLIIFIDDLQWADSASLNLIQLLTANSKYLYIIGAYRDNEVSPTHPLIQVIKKIEAAGTVINKLEIKPIALVHTAQLIEETLGKNVSSKKIKNLANLIYNKTQGNPFFLTQLLKKLIAENILKYRADLDRVDWDIRQIQAIGITNYNIVELITKNIFQLPPETQKLLKIAACIGNNFNLEYLAIVNRKSKLSTAKELWPALEAGLILPQSDNYKIPLVFDESEADNFNFYNVRVDYKFLHDRVQQAAYCLIPDSAKKLTHYRIGKLLLENYNISAEPDKIFTVVNQLNLSIKKTPSLKGGFKYKHLEKEELARLNLIAATKAKISTAYAGAINYLNIARELLSKNSWQKDYELTYNIYFQLAESEYLNTNLDKSAALCDLVLKNIQNNLDRVRFYEIKIKINLATNEIDLALKNGIKALEILGISLFESPPQELNIERLAALPGMKDADKLMAMKILNLIYAPACFAESSIALPILYTKIELSRKYGNSPPVIYAYAVYGNIVAWLVPDIDLAYQLGELSLLILERLNAKEFFAKAHLSIAINITYKKDRLKQTIAPLDRSIQTALEVGDLEFACHSANFYCEHLLFVGTDLKTVHKNQKQYIDFIENFKQEHPLILTKICGQFVDILLNESPQKELIGKIADERELIFYLLEIKNLISLFNIYAYKAQLCYLFKDYTAAKENSKIAIKYSGFIKAEYIFTLHNFYYSLAILGDYKLDRFQVNLTERDSLILRENQSKMKYWAEHCPMNFQHKYDLIEAEKARVCGQNWQAQELYEKAIQGAKQQEYIQEEALAYELAAEFYLSLGREEIAKLYLKNAYHCYNLWGANAKIRALENEYRELFKPEIITRSTLDSKSELFDLQTIIKGHRAFTSETVLEKLLVKLMKTVIENAGAEKGCLLLKKDDKWTIEAESKIDSQKIELLKSIPIDALDPQKQTPILPLKIIRYVIHTRENLVLDDAINNELYNSDFYIIARRLKSILCIPLLDRDRLKGILYLENNLATGVFTRDRVEILKILSSQAAISIENALLYDRLKNYNRNLKQTVKERTQELSETVEILKATQAELLFENALLKKTEQTSAFSYQVGGSLPMDSPTYVVRNCDRYLYQQLKQGEFCYILTARQMGKSSLMIRMMHHLQREGYICGAIDMTRIGSENITPKQWYKSLIAELWRSFGLLRKVNFKTWWKDVEDIALVQQLSRFIEEVLLVEVRSENSASAPNIVIFIDEIDSLLGLNFAVNDFFALIRSCYNQRSLDRNYRRLSFVILGVATPNNLISDYKKTPFNLGKLIKISGFQMHEAQPLLLGLKDRIKNPQTILKEILAWTGGQPFLTQKICQLILNSDLNIPANCEIKWLKNLVINQIINNWESQDEPEHFRTVRDRILLSDRALELLKLYRKIIEGEKLKVFNSSAVEELLLSGIAIERDGFLQVRNPIYQSIFNLDWVDLYL
ncbi:MAG: AAA family ATPase [Prochloraceae cyanobacterium]